MWKKVAFTVLGTFVILAAALLAQIFTDGGEPPLFAGGRITEAFFPAELEIQDQAPAEYEYDERFHRPSAEKPFKNPYYFSDFEKPSHTPPLIADRPDNPLDTMLAFFGIIREAANMRGFSGGCGTIGYALGPYPYAYELLARETRREVSLEEFVDSFDGVGHTALLKLIPLESSKGRACYFVEAEIITGREEGDDGYPQGALFAYYYGTATLKDSPGEGWGIRKIDYIAEDFLCAPWHGWSYFADAVVGIVYMENLGIVESVIRTEREGNMVYVFAEGKDEIYRFDFVRLTNGYDILLKENVFKDGKWEETDLLPEGWSYLKLGCEEK